MLKYYSPRKKAAHPLYPQPTDAIPAQDLSLYFVVSVSTGEITWATRPAAMFSDGGHTKEHNAAAWNARHAGKAACKINRQGYLSCVVGANRFTAHRIIWATHYGSWPDGQIDHINHIRTDNRIENLRCVSHWENTRNKRLLSNNTSGVCGVVWHKRSGRWAAHIKIRGKQKYLGSFDDIKDARAARKAAEREYGFHPNHGMAA